MLNPLEPVYSNILLPLAKSQIKPYVTLYNNSIQPLYCSIMQHCENYDQAVKRNTALLKTLELALQFSAYCFLYEKGWNFGTHYLGLAGGALAFSLIYTAGCWVDGQLKTNMTNICTGTWLYSKGVRNIGANREAMLVSIIIAGHLTHKHQDSTASCWEEKRHSAAEWLAELSFEKPSCNKPLYRPSDYTINAVDRGHDLSDTDTD